MNAIQQINRRHAILIAVIALWLCLTCGCLDFSIGDSSSPVAPPPPPPPSVNQTFLDVRFLHETTGIAVGYAGLIARTTDAGTTWTRQESGTTSVLRGISFSGSSVVVAVGDQGTILRSTNRGDTWARASGPILADSISDVTFLDDQVGFAVGEKGLFLKTEDAGASWTASARISNCSLKRVHFFDRNVGMSIGEDIVLRTTDGGSLWHTQAIRPRKFYYTNFNDIAFDNSGSALIVGRSLVWSSTDQGLTWDSLTTFSSGWLTAVCFASSTDVIATGLGGYIFRSSDAGRNWKSQSGPFVPAINSSYYGVAFVSKTNGYAVGVWGKIAKTTDGGISWTISNKGR